MTVDKVTNLRREVRRLSASRERATGRIHALEECVMMLSEVLKQRGNETAALTNAAEALAQTRKDQWALVPIRAGHIQKTLYRAQLDELVPEEHYSTIANALNEVREEDTE